MAKHNDTGRDGEELAIEFLAKKGLDIIERNWKFGKLEVDIIGCHEEILHFIEVKTRNSMEYGYPELAVTKRKARNIFLAAEHYLKAHNRWTHYKVDILSIIINPYPKPIDYFFIEDVTIL